MPASRYRLHWFRRLALEEKASRMPDRWSASEPCSPSRDLTLAPRIERGKQFPDHARCGTVPCNRHEAAGTDHHSRSAAMAHARHQRRARCPSRNLRSTDVSRVVRTLRMACSSAESPTPLIMRSSGLSAPRGLGSELNAASSRELSMTKARAHSARSLGGYRANA